MAETRLLSRLASDLDREEKTRVLATALTLIWHWLDPTVKRPLIKPVLFPLGHLAGVDTFRAVH